MKVFISWSGEQSKVLARILHDWIPSVIQAVDPWMSDEDIMGGARWFEEVFAQLRSAYFGIVCVTAENRGSEWLLFEAGALANTVDRARVCPVLLGVKSAEISGPLAQFQSITIERDGVDKLMASINSSKDGDLLIEKDRLRSYFDYWWPILENKVAEIELVQPVKGEHHQRSEKDLLQEVLQNTRELLRPPLGQIWTFTVSALEGMSEEDVQAAVGKALPGANPESILVRTAEDTDFEVSFSIAGRILEPQKIGEKLKGQFLKPKTAEEIRVGRNNIDRRLRSSFSA
jgi:hypothetical protein